jgi:hypothetical protein
MTALFPHCETVSYRGGIPLFEKEGLGEILLGFHGFLWPFGCFIPTIRAECEFAEENIYS